MAIDVVPKSSSTYAQVITYAGRSGGTKTEYTPFSNIYDNNSSTYWGAHWEIKGDDNIVTLTTQAEATWTVPITVSRVLSKAYMYAQFDGDSYWGEWQDYYLYVRIGSTWTTISSQKTVFPPKHGGVNTTTHNYDSSSKRVNITGVRYRARNYARSHSNPYNPNEWIRTQNKLYTMAVYSDIDDSGLRVREGSTTTKIASHPVDGENLRYYDGTRVMGIPLVSTSDSEASPIRIRTSSGTKAVQQIT
jgi:hypothetical protein